MNLILKIMKQLIYRIINESMTGTNEKFSSKKLSMFACLSTALFSALYNLFKSGFDINVFNALLLAGLGLSGLAITDKKLNDSEQEKEK